MKLIRIIALIALIVAASLISYHVGGNMRYMSIKQDCVAQIEDNLQESVDQYFQIHDQITQPRMIVFLHFKLMMCIDEKFVPELEK